MDFDNLDLFGYSPSQVRSLRFAMRVLNLKDDFQFYTSEDEIFDSILKLDKYKKSTLKQLATTIKMTNPNKFKNLPSRIKRHLDKNGDMELGVKKKTNNGNVYTRKTNDAIDLLFRRVTSNPYEFPVIGKVLIITLCTNLRLGEILQLRLADMENIMNGRPVSLKIKKRKSVVTVVPILVIYKKFYKFLTGDLKSLDSLVVKYSQSYINTELRKTLKNFGASDVDKLGVQSLRKFNTSKLLQQTTVQNVANFNRHRNVDTTLRFYNTGFYELSGDVSNLFV